MLHNFQPDLQIKQACESRLLAVTFIPGDQGSFFTQLLSLSPEVSKFKRVGVDYRLDRNATAHINNEQWLSHCHHWDQASLLNDEYFFNNLSPKTLDELQSGKGLMTFRCHPAVTKAMQVILPNLQVLYCYNTDPYMPYRYYYEKLIKPLGNHWFIEAFARHIGQAPQYLTEEIKITLLLKWLNHSTLSCHDFPTAYKLCTNKFFEDPWPNYLNLCNHYKLTPHKKEEVLSTVKEYVSKQWTAVNHITDELDFAIERHKKIQTCQRLCKHRR